MSTLTVISLPVCVMSVARVSKTWSSLETTTWWVVITGLRLNNLINNVHFCVAGKELHSVNKGSSEQQLKNKCPDCGQVLSSSRLLRARRNAVHLKMRSHLCNYCGYNTTSQSNLRIHLRRQTEEKPFACDSCDYRTSDHNSLRRHKMKHTGEKQYKCPHCSYASIQSSTYKVKKTIFQSDDYDVNYLSLYL